MYVLMHLSDLHRSNKQTLSNEELLSAIVADFERSAYEPEAVPRPDSIVVSGDLIQGVPLGESDNVRKLHDQYLLAETFLDSLCKEFLDGDRQRVVLVPGNHDINWNATMSGMSKMSIIPKEIRTLLTDPKTNVRWSWNDFSAYEIARMDEYKRRNDQYIEFITRFYASTKPLVSPDYTRNWNVFLLDSNRIAIAGFNSCTCVDCFRNLGAIPAEDISAAHLTMRRIPSVRLSIALWHHNTNGSPGFSDFVDTSTLGLLIDKGFRLGLHGHQHKPDTQPYTLTLDASYSMAVVCAGSLGADDKAIPHAHSRAFNVISIADDYCKATVHIREMTQRNIFTRSSTGPRHISWSEVPKGSMVSSGKTASIIAEYVNDVERLLSIKASSDASEIVLAHPGAFEGSFPRELACRALSEARKWAQLIGFIGLPKDNAELAYAIDARISTKDFAGADSILISSNGDSRFDQNLINELITRLKLSERATK